MPNQKKKKSETLLIHLTNTLVNVKFSPETPFIASTLNVEGSVLKGRDTTLLTKVCLIKLMIFPESGMVVRVG